jgi:hypothetical protein
MTTGGTLAMRDWIAELLDSQSSWRTLKAQEWPDDLRNRRSSDALAAAAEYVRNLEEPNQALYLFGEFLQLMDDEAEQQGFAIEAATFVGGSSIAGRFFFDNGTRDPEPSDFDRLVLDMFYETLEGWRTTIEDSGVDGAVAGGRVAIGLPLVEFFAEHGYPLFVEDDDEDAEAAADRPAISVLAFRAWAIEVLMTTLERVPEETRDELAEEFARIVSRYIHPAPPEPAETVLFGDAAQKLIRAEWRKALDEAMKRPTDPGSRPREDR